MGGEQRCQNMSRLQDWFTKSSDPLSEFVFRPERGIRSPPKGPACHALEGSKVSSQLEVRAREFLEAG